MVALPIWQRLLAALAYVLPWSDALPFGRALFRMVPALSYLALPALPLTLLTGLLPLGNLLLFFVLYLAVARNPRVPWLIRFHVLQAILIDILLVVLGLAFEVLLQPLAGGFGFLVRTLANTVFLGALLLVLFGVVQSLRGQEADIPTLSDAVRMQLD